MSYNDEMNFEQQVQEFLKEHEDDHDHYQQHQQQQFDDGQLTTIQNNEDVDGHNEDLDHDMINDDDNELTRNDDDLLLEMENCIN